MATVDISTAAGRVSGGVPLSAGRLGGVFAAETRPGQPHAGKVVVPRREARPGGRPGAGGGLWRCWNAEGAGGGMWRGHSTGATITDTHHENVQRS